VNTQYGQSLIEKLGNTYSQKGKKEMNTTAIQKPKTEPDTIDLFSLGSLVNLKVKHWSGRRMLTREDLVKLGYDPNALPKDIVNLGRKLMVPKTELQYLNQIEQRARKALERWSSPFGICNAHFVPATMLPTVEQQIEELKEEFFIRVDSFISRFDELRDKVKETHPDFWDKCLKGNYPKNPKALREHFQFDWYTFRIAGIGSIEETSVEEVIAKQTIQTEREVELRKKMKDEVGAFVVDYVSSMRKETIRFCDLMTSRIDGKPYGEEEDSKKLTPKSISCFRNYVDRFRQMNIFGDNEIEKMLSEFRNTFLDSGTSPSDFESATVKNSVSKALQTLREKAAIEGESCSKFLGELRRKVIL
jgi:hypothetical protein